MALYAAQAVGWQVAHQLQHRFNDTSCCLPSESSSCSVDSDPHEHCHSHDEDGTHDHHAHLAGDEPAESNHGPVEHEHDSSDCWTCHFLSQASNTQFELAIELNDSLLDVVFLDVPKLYDATKVADFWARGPPAIALQLS